MTTEFYINKFGKVLEITYDSDNERSIRKQTKVLKAMDFSIDSRLSNAEAESIISQSPIEGIDNKDVVLNLTTYTLKVGEKIIFPTGELPFLERSSLHNAVTINGVKLISSTTGKIMNLPPKKDGIVYVVSRDVAEASLRDDFMYPEKMTEKENLMEVSLFVNIV